MLPIAYYLLKVIICSGILYGYYRIALHNKIFHRWNRFFLLGVVITSLSFPLIRINILHNPADDGQIVKLLNVVTTGDEYVHEVSRNGSSHISGEQLAMAAYIMVSLALLVVLVHTLIRLSRMARHNPLQKIHHILLVQTEEKGTPFSFFRYIFWNRNIDLHSDVGNKIFRHEMVHVTEKHSADKLFMHIVLLFFWCNPFFWLIRREMNMIHEFIADSKAIEDNDTAAFAAMVLQATYPQQAFGLTSSFFSSSIKRRLHMLTQIQYHPRISYISRVLALPLLVFVFAAFSIKIRQFLPDSNQGITTLMKPVTVVIDAGHGGNDNGAISPGGIKEKDITLSIVRKVAELNNNKNILIILTREGDVLQPVKEKVTFALQQKPDAFISLHINAASPGTEPRSGFEILLSQYTTAYSRQSQLLGSLLATEIEKTYGVTPALTQRRGQGVWVLDAPEISYPSLLLSCGYLSSKSDLAFITSEANQERIARDILTAIERFAKAKEEITVLPQKSNPVLQGASAREAKNSLNTSPHTATPLPVKKQSQADTLPANVKSVDITRNNEVIVIYKNNTAEKITRTEAIKRGITPVDKIGIDLSGGNMRMMDSVLFFVEGVEIDRSGQEKINPDDIESINIIKDKQATDKYGERGKNGVIEISLKKEPSAAGDKIIFQKVEKAPEFPGGKSAWTKYISGAINKAIDSLQEENKSGTCMVQFIVDTKGNLSEIKPLTMEGTLLSRIVVDALKNGPKWIPARQNGHVVKAYHQQPVTFQIAEEK